MTGAYPASVFVVIPVDDVVTVVFDAPVTTVGLEDMPGVGLLRRATGDAVNGFGGNVQGLFVDPLPFDDKSPTDMGEVEIVIEFGRGPDLSRFDASMSGVDADEIGFSTLLKIQAEIFEELGLVALDGEVVMGPAVFDQIAGESALGQQGIGADGLAFYVDRLQQGDGRLDLVGLLNLIILPYRQDADFFWVWQIRLR